MNAKEAMKIVEKAIDIVMYNGSWPEEEMDDLEDAIFELEILAKRAMNSF